MKHLFKLFALLFVATLSITSCSDSDDDKGRDDSEIVKIDKKHDTALLLATFGSTWEDPHKTYKETVAAFKKEFPDTDVYLSFTSNTCITRWGAKTGEYFSLPKHWLEAIGKAGYKKVLVQSLHVIPGQEYNDELKVKYIGQFKKDYPSIPVVLGDPLLVSDQDIKEVGDVLYNAFKDNLKKGEAVAFLGHGNPDEKFEYANMSYDKMEKYMQSLNPKMFVGTVDWDDMSIETIMEQMDEKIEKGATINLTPLMSIAGDHANNDMAGDYDKEEKDEDQSWKVFLTKAGYKVEAENCVLKGLGDYPEVVNVWKRHLHEAIAKDGK